MKIEVKDNIDLDILLNYGYKRNYDEDTGELKRYIYNKCHSYQIYVKDRIIIPANSNEPYYEDRYKLYSHDYVVNVLFKLIKDDIVEIVD